MIKNELNSEEKRNASTTLRICAHEFERGEKPTKKKKLNKVNSGGIWVAIKLSHSVALLTHTKMASTLQKPDISTFVLNERRKQKRNIKSTAIMHNIEVLPIDLVIFSECRE